MKRTGILCLMLVAPSGAFAQFSIGNLVAMRVGDGSAALTSAATSVFIDQFTTAGAAVNSSAITGLTLSGTASSEGHMSYVYFGGDGSDVGNWGVAYGGYSAAAGTASVTGTTTARRGGVLRFNGTQTAVDLTAGTTPFSGNNIRSVAFDGQTNTYLAVGANTGLVRADGTGASTVASTTVTNNRFVQIAGNDAFFSTGSGATRGIYLAPGAASGGTGITATNIVNMGGSASPYDFEIIRDALGTPVNALVTDDTTTSGIGGLYLATGWSGTAFGAPTQIATNAAITSALNITTGTISIRDMVVVGTDVYATTTETSNNRIVKLSFASGFGGGLTGATTLTQAGTNKVFRGIEMVPEPASMAIMGIGLAGLAARRRRKA